MHERTIPAIAPLHSISRLHFLLITCWTRSATMLPPDAAMIVLIIARLMILRSFVDSSCRTDPPYINGRAVCARVM